MYIGLKPSAAEATELSRSCVHLAQNISWQWQSLGPFIQWKPGFLKNERRTKMHQRHNTMNISPLRQHEFDLAETASKVRIVYPSKILITTILDKKCYRTIYHSMQLEFEECRTRTFRDSDFVLITWKRGYEAFVTKVIAWEVVQIS